MGKKKTVATFCRVCEAACGLEVTTQDNRIIDVAADRQHPVSRGFLCSKAARAADLHHSPDRIRHPMKRIGDQWHPISWPQALHEIGERVRKLRQTKGSHSIAMYMGNPAAFSITHALFCQAFMAGVGSRNLFTAGSQDCNNKFVVAQHMYGSPAVQPIPDVDNTQCLIVVGSNPAISHMSFVSMPRTMERISAVEKRGGKVFFVNPRFTESARRAGEQVFIRPGTDLWFLLAFLNELIKTGAIRQDLIDTHMKNWPAIVTLAEPWSPEAAAPITGISSETLRSMVAHYRNASAATLYCSTGINQTEHGTLAYWILNVINCVSGNFNKAGGAIISQGLIPHARIAKHLGIGTHKTQSRIGGFNSVMDSMPAGIMPDEILTPGKDQIRALFVSAGNPLLSCPNARHVEEALKELELLVCIDMFRNETGNLAHYVLPGLSFFERADLPMPVNGFQPTPYLQWSDAVVLPDGEQKDEWWIYRELARSCNIQLFDGMPGASWMHRFFMLDRLLGKLPLVGRHLGFGPERMMHALVLASRQITPWQLKRHPHGVLLKGNQVSTDIKKLLLTDDHLIDLAPAAFVAASGALEEEAHRICKNGQELLLIGKRERHTHNSWMHNVAQYVQGQNHTNYLDMHPDDASKRTLSDRDLVDVRTATGSVRAVLRITRDLMPGVVALPHGWGHQEASGLSIACQTDGVNVNVLTPDGPQALERLAGMAPMDGIPVEVCRAEHAKQDASRQRHSRTLKPQKTRV